MKKTTGFKSFTAVMTLAIALTLSACSNQTGGANQTEPPAASPEATGQPSLEPSSSPEQNETPQQTSVSTGSTNEGKDGSGQGASAGSSEASDTLHTLISLAKEGKVPGAEYAAHVAMFDDIEKSWGKPDRNETAGKGIYATYEDKGITFGYNKGMKVFDVRSYSDKLHAISLKDIEKELGKPDETTVNGRDDIYTYEISKQYQLKFIVPQGGAGVDHISVFSPDDAKNNMAG